MRVCQNCGIALARSSQKKYCSRSCAATANNKAFPKRVSVPKGEREYSRITVECARCGRDMLTIPGRPRKFCKKCALALRMDGFKDRCLLVTGKECELCHESKPSAELHFHHVDKRSKEFEIGSSAGRKWENTLRELSKCIVLCRSCHSRLHRLEEQTRRILGDA